MAFIKDFRAVGGNFVTWLSGGRMEGAILKTQPKEQGRLESLALPGVASPEIKQQWMHGGDSGTPVSPDIVLVRLRESQLTVRC